MGSSGASGKLGLLTSPSEHWPHLTFHAPRSKGLRVVQMVPPPLLPSQPCEAERRNSLIVELPT